MAGLDPQLAQIGAVLVEERVLRRIIKRHRRLPGIGLQIPHAHCYTLPRADLERFVERDELAVDPATLPDRVIAVRAWRSSLAAGNPRQLSRLWRQVYHGQIHIAYDELVANGTLTMATFRDRIQRIGQTEFDEIRSVLRQEELLLPPADDATTYVEFVALYLELAAFAPRALARTFPAIFDTAHVDATIALDIDAKALLARARPTGAPELPVTDEIAERPIQREPPAEIVEPAARKRALKARTRGNRARAAILAFRGGAGDSAHGDLDELVARLSRALGNVPTDGWTDALLPVARCAANERVLRFTAGAQLLHDLQAACVVAEREVKIVDIAGWVMSRGKRAAVRSLPATREVRVAKHVHAAAEKIATCAVGSAEERDKLADTVHAMVEYAERNVRTTLRPKIEAALAEVGLVPRHLPEKVAEKKVVDELLDQAVAVGRLSLGNLRDALSGNDLKLPDLELAQLKSGDPLLRCDRILAQSLDGVYRSGEVYLRFLQKLSSIFFGRPVLRFVSRYALLPYLAAFTVLAGLQHIVGPLQKLTGYEEWEIDTFEREMVGTGLLFLLLNVPPFRRAFVWLIDMVIRILRLLLFDLPRLLWRLPVVRRVLDSIVFRWGIKPGVPAAVVWWFTPGILRWPVTAGAFVVLAVAINSRLGRIAEETATDWIVRSSRQVTSRIVPALLRYILRLFSELVELMDRGLYRVDEWLRFKAGQSVITLVIKGTLGTLWGVISYFLRLYINLFIEPTVNPIKHFPVVTVAAKLLIPFLKPLMDSLSPILGNWFAGFTILVIPGLAGFLVWELKENWKLYRANRAKNIAPIAIGHHGESFVGLLRPGFHSGTIPKLYTKLRRAAWQDDERADARHKEALHHVEEAIWKFADRELVAMLDEAPQFPATDVAMAHVEIGSNRVQIELVCPSVGPQPLAIRFEQQSGWIVVNIADIGWVDDLPDAARKIFEISLAGFYKLAGVDIVREQLESALGGPDGVSPYDISDEGVVVWPAGSYHAEVVYDLRSANLTPKTRGEVGSLPPSLAGPRVIYSRVPLRWSTWTTAWLQLGRGEEPVPVVIGPSILPARHAPRRQATISGVSRVVAS